MSIPSIFKSICIAVTALALVAQTAPVWAQARILIATTPIESPQNWEEAYSPGDWILEDMLAELEGNSTVHFIPLDAHTQGEESMNPSLEALLSKEMAGDAMPTMMSKKIPSAAQIVLRGQVKKFDPNAPSPIASKAPSIMVQEHAALQLELMLIDTLTGRTLNQRTLTVKSSDGRNPFTSSARATAEFYSASMGIAVKKAAMEAARWIESAVAKIPLEGKVIDTGPEERLVTINLGTESGIKVRDLFNVYSIKFQLKDPDTHAVLGDQYLLEGAIRVIEVQDKISRAMILAGENIKKNQLIRMK
ncbi:MAG: hypothetical protein G3M78_11620 [Candidatus Nitrohelix vancouverensis]|uniref:Flagellar assembly protein T C-terminal domain-containing protein n=1 Tax=Candidatus Nitrohelix vancouverensis TaxID=2705534 RepID=A0A7T0C3Z9_9BACT|nr:MAG: hypothetical protein G3M78_11620 [Candidatus Nitrohelix vancouverensis]